jgi:tetratricopeptide (TPR) repeat protein
MNETSPLELLPKRSVLLSIVALFFFLLLIVYGTSLSYGFVRWDDGMLIYENPAIRGITLKNLYTVFTTYDPELYIPLTLISYQLDYMIGGINPAIYHFHNLFLHLVNSLLVSWLLLCLLRKKWMALFLGLLFAVHPLNTETVIWASARKDLLSIAFFLLSIISYITWRQNGSKKFYIGSIAAFALGLLAKVTIIGLPLLLILIDWKEGRPANARIVKEKIPYFAFSILFAIIAFFGKTGVLGSSTFTEKILIPTKSFIFYIEKFILPTNLSVLYPFTSNVSFANPALLIPLVVMIAIISIGIYSLKSTKTIFFGLAWFALCVSPSVLNFSKGDFLYFASDRYAYAGMIGLLVILGTYLSKLIDESRHKEVLASGCAVILFGMGITGYMQSMTWESSQSLFQNAIDTYPNSAIAYNNIGNHLRSTGETDKAIEHYDTALSLSRQFSRNTSDLKEGESKILANLGSAHREQGDIHTAETAYREALELNPKNALALQGTGLMYMQVGKDIMAVIYYEKAIEANPLLVTPYVNLGSVYVQRGDYAKAIEILEQGLEINPFFPQVHFNLSSAYKKTGRNRESLESLEKAVEIEPKFVAARINLGIAYAERKMIEEAIEQFQAILQYDPSNARARSAIQQLTGR